MRPESARFLVDILAAAESIAAYTRGESLESYLAQRQVRDAVQWNFILIGEAVSQLHRIDATIAEQISEWQRIIAFRNQLIHGYGVIQSEITWDIIQNKLPALVADVRRLLPA